MAPLHGVPPSSSTPNGVPGRESSRNQVPGHSRLVDLNWRAPLAQWPARHSTAFPRLRVFSHEALDLASELLDGQKMREQQWAAHLMEQVPVDKRLGSAIRLRNAGGVRDVKELMTAVFEARTHPDSAVVTQVEIKEVRLANGQSVTVEQILTNAGLLRRLPDGQVRALKSTIPDIGRFDAGGLSLMEAKEPSTILRAHGHVVAEDRFRARRAPGPGFQVKSSEVALQDAEREAVRQFGLQNPGSHLVMDVTELDGTPVHDLAVPSDRVKRPHVGPYEMPVH